MVTLFWRFQSHHFCWFFEHFWKLIVFWWFFRNFIFGWFGWFGEKKTHFFKMFFLHYFGKGGRNWSVGSRCNRTISPRPAKFLLVTEKSGFCQLWICQRKDKPSAAGVLKFQWQFQSCSATQILLENSGFPQWLRLSRSRWGRVPYDLVHQTYVQARTESCWLQAVLHSAPTVFTDTALVKRVWSRCKLAWH